MARVLLISFEGIEASGKTTQIARLAERLCANNSEIVMTREPHDGPIRDLLLPEGMSYQPLTQLFLFAAARHQHIVDVIRPAMNEGKIVLCDRFIDSTVAYQGYGLGVPLDLIARINEAATGALLPDISFIFDLDISLQRARLRSRGVALMSYERLGDNFHQKVREGFLDIAKNAPQRCHLLDGSRSEDDLGEEIWDHIRSRLS